MNAKATPPRQLQVHERLRGAHAVEMPSTRSFGITFTVVFALVAAASWWFAFGSWPLFAALSAGTLAVTLAVPAALEWPNRAWFRLSLVLHAVFSQVVLMLLFVGAVLPTGLLMRIVGRDALRLRKHGADASYWIVRSDAADPRSGRESMRDQF